MLPTGPCGNYAAASDTTAHVPVSATIPTTQEYNTKRLQLVHAS